MFHVETSREPADSSLDCFPDTFSSPLRMVRHGGRLSRRGTVPVDGHVLSTILSTRADGPRRMRAAKRHFAEKAEEKQSL
nr:hypothetical protein RVX_1886 [Nitratidesulfovibrio sp. HK-II]